MRLIPSLCTKLEQLITNSGGLHEGSSDGINRDSNQLDLVEF